MRISVPTTKPLPQRLKPMASRPSPQSPETPGDSLAPARAHSKVLRYTVGAAMGAIPAAGLGYAIASANRFTSVALGGSVGLVMGYLSGKGLSATAQQIVQSGSGKLNFMHKAALKFGSAAPYVWAVVGAVGGATAASTLHPGVVAGLFARKGGVAGALYFGSQDAS